MDRPIVLYDDDCGFCKRLLSKFLAWDRRGLLCPVALQDREADRLLGEMDDERKMACRVGCYVSRGRAGRAPGGGRSERSRP
jgi:predicted DCC family thiol-disulfide oxidoreductase YuxK